MTSLVEFRIGDETLRGTLFIPSGKGPFPGVVFFHGRGSSRKNYLSMAKKLSENGVMSLAFDFRGCGESDGNLSDQTHLMGIEDGRAGLQFLLLQNIDRNRVGIEGTSFGGYVAAMILPDFDFVKSVALRVPASYSDREFNTSLESFRALRRKGYFKKRENWIDSSAYKNIAKFSGSLLVIRSEFDETITDEAVNKYYEDAKNAVKRDLYLQKGAGHDFHSDPKGLKLFHEITVDWFLKTL